MVISLYTITKKRNSTKQPTGTGTDVNAYWNDGASSLLAPSLRVTLPNDSYLTANYCKIASLGRYYYITDWTYNGDGTWTAALQVDVLASWKTQIQSSYGYVDRAADATLRNTAVMDTFYPATLTQLKSKSATATSLYPAPSQGCFLLSILSADPYTTPTIGPITCYYMTPANLKDLVNNMLDITIDWDDISALSEDVLKSFVNPMQYITRVMWLPFPHTFLSNTEINLGGWATGAYGGVADAQMFTFRYTLNVPAGTGYKRYPPYATYTFISPVFGVFSLDGTIVSQHSTLAATIHVNAINGNATLIVTTNTTTPFSIDDEYELFRASTQLGIEVPMAQISTNYAGMARGAMAAATSLSAGWAGVPGIISGITSSVEAAISPSAQSTGSLSGGFNVDIGKLYIEAVFYGTVEENPTDFGYPVKKQMQLSNVLGYVKLAHSDFDAGCTSTEKDQIIS